jgi:Fe-S cluster assembly protein SufB
MSISEAIREHPELVKKYLGSVVPTTDNFYATLNSAVFTDGSFVFVPKGVRCPMELSTYFRINEKNTGQFERTLIIAEEGAYVSYLEGCTAPQRDENQLACRRGRARGARRCRDQIFDRAELVSGRRTARAASTTSSPSAAIAGHRIRRSPGRRSRPVRRSPGNIRPASCAAMESQGEFYSIAVSNGYQQIDSGTKMIHLGKNTEPDHLQGHFRRLRQNTYRGQVSAAPQGGKRAQFHQVRLAADRRPVRRAYGALHRGEELDGEVRARGDDVEDLRRPEVLRHAARHPRRSGDRADRQRLRQGSHPGAADGVRR